MLSCYEFKKVKARPKIAAFLSQKVKFSPKTHPKP